MDNKYKEKVVYEDCRGNIKNITRNGLISNNIWAGSYGVICGTYGEIDKLTLNYQATSKNRVQSISDAAAVTFDPLVKHGFEPKSGAGDYLYDENGNLKKDDHKETRWRRVLEQRTDGLVSFCRSDTYYLVGL